MKLKLISLLSLMMIWGSLYAQSNKIELVNQSISIDAKNKYKDAQDSTFSVKIKIRLFKPAEEKDKIPSIDLQLVEKPPLKNIPLTFSNNQSTAKIEFVDSDWPTDNESGFKEIEKELKLKVGIAEETDSETDLYELKPGSKSVSFFNLCNSCQAILRVNKPQPPQGTFEKITLLNAYNFDFNNTVKSNYLFHLNWYEQPAGSWKFGFNVGIMKVNYASSASKKTEQIENVSRTILRPPVVGEYYDRQLVQYNTDAKNRMWSTYFQPMWGLTNNKKVFVSLHGHLELLRNDWSYKSVHKVIAQDSQIVTANDRRTVFVSGARDTSWNTNSFFNGYYGVGLTMNVQENKLKLFFQGTIGATTNYPNPSSMSIDAANFIFNKATKRDWNAFYLVRSNIHYAISSKSTVIIGTEIRGLFPRYDPLFALYAGLNLNLDSLLDILK